MIPPGQESRPLGFGEALGIVLLIFVPVLGLLGLVVLAFSSQRPHLRGLARAALLWHVLLWLVVLGAILSTTFFLVRILWDVFTGLGPVR